MQANKLYVLQSVPQKYQNIVEDAKRMATELFSEPTFKAEHAVLYRKLDNSSIKLICIYRYLGTIDYDTSWQDFIRQL